MYSRFKMAEFGFMEMFGNYLKFVSVLDCDGLRYIQFVMLGYEACLQCYFLIVNLNLLFVLLAIANFRMT